MKVSVCMITYNHEQYIKQAIEGVLSQITNFQVEFVISNDCSTDNTHYVINELISQVTEKFSVRYSNHKKNIGISANFAYALRQCSGEYIATCEGDDFWTNPNKLQTQIDFLESNSDYLACLHNVAIVDKEGVEMGLVFNETHKSDIYFFDLLNGYYFKLCSLVFRNDTQKLLPLLKEELQVEDDSLGYCLLVSGGKCRFIADVMSSYRVHPSGVWSMISPMERCKINLVNLKKYKVYFSDDDSIAARFNKKILGTLKIMIVLDLKSRRILAASKGLFSYLWYFIDLSRFQNKRKTVL